MNTGRPRFADSPHEFAHYLHELKEQGSNLLVTGNVPDDVTARATRTLFGQGSRRYRVLALLDSTRRVPESLSVDEDHVWVIKPAGEERSVPANASDAVSPEDPTDLDSIRREIATAAAFYDDRFGELGPSELRVGVGLDAEEEVGSIEQFIDRTAEIVVEHRGMAHYHLPKPDDDPLVSELSPLFDARIELRQQSGQPPEQRWHVPSFDKTTFWVRL